MEELTRACCDDDDPEHATRHEVLHFSFHLLIGVVLASVVQQAYCGSGARTGSVLPSTWFTGTLSSPYQNTTGRKRLSSVRLM